MTTRKILPILGSLLLLTFTLNGQIAEKTLVRAFNLQGNQNILLDISGDVQVEKWDQEQMRIMLTITLQDGSEMMLKNLVKVGRYNLTAEDTENGLKIFAPGLEKQVKLRSGATLEENISMVVYAPSNVVVATPNDTPATGPDGSF